MKAPGHDKANPETAEEEQQGFDLDQQDSATWASLIQLTTAGGLTGSKYIGDTIQAFKTVSDENIHQRLLNLQNPEELRKVISDHKLIARRLKNKKKDSTKFAFYKFKGEITRDRFERVEQAIQIAQHVHQHTARLEESIKADKAISRFALSEENSQQLKKGLSEWREKNPHASIDDELSRQAKKIYRDQCNKEGKKADSKVEQALKNDFLTARDEAILRVTESGIFERAEGVLKHDTLDPQNARLTEEQLKTRLDYIYEGKIPEEKLAAGFTEVITEEQLIKSEAEQAAKRKEAEKEIPKAPGGTQLPEVKIPAAKPEFDLSALSGGLAEGAHFENILEGTKPKFDQPLAEKAPEKIISQHKGPPGGPPPPVTVPSVPKVSAPRLVTSHQSYISFILSRMQVRLQMHGLGGSLLSKGLGKLSGKLAGKALAQLGLGAATGGIYTAASIIAGLMGVDLEGFIIKAALFTIGVPVVLVVLLVFTYNNLFDPRATPVGKTFYQNSKDLAWKNFEEKNLKILEKTSSWAVFEKEHLGINYRLVDLSLDADRHDDVKE